MALIADFKKFAFKGNVIDLAVGVIIGAAFGKIVSALVADMIMPVVSLALPSGSWRTAGVVLKKAADPKDDIVLRYGVFIGQVVDFLLVALALFLIVSRLIKAFESKPAEAPPPPATQECRFCCETIPAAAVRCKFCTSELAPAKLTA